MMGLVFEILREGGAPGETVWTDHQYRGALVIGEAAVTADWWGADDHCDRVDRDHYVCGPRVIGARIFLRLI